MVAPLICEQQRLEREPRNQAAAACGLIDDMLAGRFGKAEALVPRLRPLGLATWPRLVMLLAIPATRRLETGQVALARLVASCAGDEINVLGMPRGPHQLLLLVAPSRDAQEHELRRSAAAFADRLSDEVRRQLGISALVGVGKIVAEPAELGVSLAQARRACSRAAFLGRDRVVFEEDALAASAANPYPIQIERDVCKLVRAGRRDRLLELVPELASAIASSTGGAPKQTKVRAGELAAVVSRAALEAGAEEHVVSACSCAASNKLTQLASLAGLRDWLRDVLGNFAEAVAGRRPHEQRIVDRAIHFIHANFAQDLSLRRVADAVHISPYYLSHLFRKQHGCTFLECLTHTRVEEAKRLLEEPSLAISEVGSQVGYVDANYFAQVFRRVTGITPSGYRRNVSSVRGSAARR